MKTTLTRESPSRVRLSVEATPAEVRPAIDRAVRALGNEVKIPGFRKGKVPRKVLETRLGPDALREATLREAIPELLARAVADETLQPVAPPSVEVTGYDLDSDLTFDATVEVRPEIDLPDLDGFRATRRGTKATLEEIDEQLRRLQDRFATLEPVPRNAHRGDYVMIDLHATQHAEQIAELSATDQLYEVGAGWFVPELDDQLENARAGDILQFNATLPEGAPERWAGQEVTFRALVKEVRRKALPPIDDDFAKTASEFDTLDELRGDVGERIERVKGVQADADVRQQVLEQVVDEVEVEPPESLVRDEMAYRLRRLEEQLNMAGLGIDRYLTETGRTEEQVEADLRRQAERNVRAHLILEEIARREGLGVTEEELREEVARHAEAIRHDPSDLAKRLGEGGRLGVLAADILRRKALNLLVERADIKEEEGEEAPASEE